MAIVPNDISRSLAVATLFTGHLHAPHTRVHMFAYEMREVKLKVTDYIFEITLSKRQVQPVMSCIRIYMSSYLSYRLATIADNRRQSLAQCGSMQCGHTSTCFFAIEFKSLSIYVCVVCVCLCMFKLCTRPSLHGVRYFLITCVRGS